MRWSQIPDAVALAIETPELRRDPVLVGDRAAAPIAHRGFRVLVEGADFASQRARAGSTLTWAHRVRVQLSHALTPSQATHSHILAMEDAQAVVDALLSDAALYSEGAIVTPVSVEHETADDHVATDVVVEIEIDQTIPGVA